MTKHSLVGKDLTNLRATCSVCGPVAIRKAGNGYVCSVKKAESHKSWTERNPDKAAANRRVSSAHTLTDRDYVKLTATCAICGPATMAMWGRGYACAALATERRDVQETRIQEWCRECWAEMEGKPDRTKVYLLADGTCPRHDDLDALDLSLMLKEHEQRAADWDGIPPGFHEPGPDPYAMPDYEAAVPGWRTIGGSRAEADAWLTSNGHLL